MTHEAPRYIDFSETPNQEIVRVPTEVQSPTTILGNLAVSLVIGHAMAAEMGVTPTGSTTLPVESVNFNHGINAILDTVYTTDSLREASRHQ